MAPKTKQTTSTPLILPPDAAILIQARIKAGQRNFRIPEIANLILHDPILTLEFFQFANSAMYGGPPLADIEAALTRIGTERLVSTLAELNSKCRVADDAGLELFEVLRYNCRRTSILGMIIAAVTRPQLAQAVRTSGLFADLGHMLALRLLGEKYCDAARQLSRKNLVYRLEKDHKLNVNSLMLKHLRAKSAPERLLLAYDLEQEIKANADADIRFCVRSAIELVEAHDAGKLSNYGGDKPLPVQSYLRLLNLAPMQVERLIKAAGEYLKRVAEQEAPEGASLLITSIDDDEQPVGAGEEGGRLAEAIPLPSYPNSAVNTKSREALQDFFDLCAQQQSEFDLKERAVEYLKRSGLFERVAMVRVRKNSDEAGIDHSCGLGLKRGDTVPIADPLSPFNLFRLEIKSCNTKTEAIGAPFGVSAYAIGPVDASADGDRVLLYADRAGAQALSMESRRVFRLVLGLMTRSVQSVKEKAGSAPKGEAAAG